MIVSSGEDRRVHITFNGQELLPTWTSTDFSTVLQVNEYLTDLKIRRNGATNLDGIGLTNSGRLFYLKKTGTAVTLTLKTNNVKSIVYEQNNPVAYAFFNTGQVQRINLNTGNLFNAGTISSWLAPNAAIKLSSRISGVGSGLGHILVPGLNITTVTNQSLMTNPVKLNVAEFHTTANTVRIAGTDGTLYERNGGAWVIVRTQSNKDIYAVQEKAGEIFVAGETGYFTNGTVSGGVYNSTDIVLTTGLTAEQSVNDHLYDIAIDQEKIYAVGANGRVVFKPGTFVPFASVVQGTNDIYGVNVNVNGIYTVGEGSEIHFVSGANYIKKKDIYTPPMRDVHFSTATIGSIVADNFTVRTTIDGGLNWTAVVPNVLPVAADYAQVWTVDANRSLIFGNGLPFESLSNNANQLPTGPIQVTDLDRQGNTLYVANTNSVYLMNLTANTFGTPISISGQAKGIKARQNGAFAVTGENGYFACYDLSGTSTYTAIPSLLNSADFNDLEIVDNNRIVLVGDDGAWWETSETQYDVNGNLNGAIWFDQTGIYAPGSDPYDVTAGNMVNIYDVEFATAVDGILGGEYNPSFWYYNAASYAYVRKFYAPGARYSARFFYDKLGRLIVSQNSRQYTEEDGNGNPTPKFSYTLYDALGRVVEVGEKTENPTSASSVTFKNVFGTNVSGFFNPSVIDDNNLVAWVNGNGPRKEVTKSYYDATIISITDPNVNFAPNELTQRKRIVHVTYEGVFDGNDQTYDHASHYDYDIHGNVKTLVQDNQKMANEFPSIADQRYKRMDYLYDLVSGNVHRMSVQDGELDQWHHAYRYDADNRIISAHTNKETPILSSSGSEAVISQALENELVQNTDWQQDAKYFYYDHGPLARTELGEQQLQGMDYVYNLQGWMKGVNATSLDVNVDPGRDGASTSLSGQPNNPNEVFANDVMAFSLHYYDQFDYEDENGNPVTTNDYTPIGAGGLTPLISVLPAANITNSDIAANSNDLFNGNIKAMQTTLTNPTTYDAMPMGNAYQYDQLNRLLSSKSFINLSGNQWGNSGTYDNRYLNTFEYDAMGNIIHQNRYTEAGVQIEDMSYGYKRDTDGNLLRNRLYHINEPVGLTSLDDSDIDDMGGTFNPQLLNIETAYNYAYDEEGRLIKDSTEKIDLIVWRVDGKVKEIHRPAGSDKKNISFDYDAMGNRIAKHVFDDDWNLEKTTHYLLDAQGNQMSVYEHEVANSNVTYTLKERHIYGSSSLGILMDSILMGSSTSGNTVNELGLKTYSMSNHLGNVLTVISDIKIPQASGGTTTTGYRVGIRNISDYSPFGVLLAERAVENEFFRTGFQGSERDDEVKGDGNSYTTELRQLDPRLGRWLSIDPKTNTYESPYVSMGNNPIFFNDPFGDTLKTDNTQQANSDIKALGGKYQDIIDVSDPNNIVINFDLVKSQEKFQKKGEFNENKFEKYKSKAMKHAGISLINDIASASENILYTSNWVINLSDESGKVYERDFSELSGITEGDNGIAGINNHSTTPRGDEYTSYQPEDPSKIQGHVNIISGKYGYYRISNGVKTLQIITKGSVVYHELRENYLRTVMKMPYPKAHPQSSKDEGITYGNGNPGNATYVKYDEKP
jgi:RHS repeat-associated protein